MLRRNLLLGVAGVAVLGVTGCATHPVSVQQATELPAAQLRTCIKRAAHRRGWRVVTDEPGKMRIKYVKGPHVLVADVTYDNEGYMIEAVKEGSTLFNKDGTAHRKVNSWTANLTVTIREEENKILLRQTNGLSTIRPPHRSITPA